MHVSSRRVVSRLASEHAGDREALLCLIVSRNLGDAVMHLRVLRRLIEGGAAHRYLVWTFPQAAFLFEDIDACDVIVSTFPAGASLRAFRAGGWRSFLRALREIRSRRPSLCVELIGDFREHWLARSTHALRSWSIGWGQGHPFLHHIRTLPWQRPGSLEIPAEVPNLYDAHDLAVGALLCGRKAAAAKADDLRVPSRVRTIGIHPSASQACKRWPERSWRELLRNVVGTGKRVLVFGAPSERDALVKLTAGLPGDIEIVTVALSSLADRIAPVDVFIGLDSFGVHLAAWAGVRCIVLVGPNDPAVFTPPGASAVHAPGVCPVQPCHGRPQCVGKSWEYVCMRSIEPSAVGDALQAVQAV